MHRNPSVNVHDFAMVPRAEVPRSSFRMQKALKTTLNAGHLVPILCEEVLPGDTWNARLTLFARMATPLFPVMDNLYCDTFFFFVPNRLVWANWQRFMGERDPDPDSSISYTIPQVQIAAGANIVGSIYDFFGIPPLGQTGSNAFTVNALPFRAYNLIWNQWFRDENLQQSQDVDTDDGPDTSSQYTVMARGKRHDYFTSALPFLQKGSSVSLPLGSTAPVIPDPAATSGPTLTNNTDPARVFFSNAGIVDTTWNAPSTITGQMFWADPNLVADLSAATAATINQIRQAFQVQRLLERDARGGTRYTELVRAHFGVVSPDARLQRPEYLGGGSAPININPIAQTSATAVTGSDTPQGNLAAFAQGLARTGFTQSFTEHGYIIGLVSFRADLTYQQGLRRHWSRSTRYDYYWPAFANLGEQSILNKEIYFKPGVSGGAQDAAVFGYQERWAEMRYLPSEITGYFRSTETVAIDQWHLAQEFTSLPVLDSAFILEQPPLSRVLAVGTEAAGQQFLLDCFYDIKAARPLPMYSVPGLIDHF